MDWRFAVSSAKSAPSTAPILLTGDVEDNLVTAAALGYDAIEVHTRENAPLDLGRIRAVSADCGCKVGMIVTGRLNTETGASLINDDPALETLAREGLRRYIDMAAALDAGVVLGWLRGRIPAGKDRRPYLDRLGERLCEAGAYAKAVGVPVNIEVINRYEVNVFVTASELTDFLAVYAPDNCFVHLDTFHMGIEERSMAAAILSCKGALGYVHVADNTRQFPGSGSFDFPAVLRALTEIGYGGYVSVECLPIPDGKNAAKAAIDYLKSTINRERIR